MASDNGKPPATGKPPVARLLYAGARGAERMAQATGVDRALDEAVEEAIVRALRSPSIARALERGLSDNPLAGDLQPDEVAELVRRFLRSEAAQRAWDEVLASSEAQMLVERIAGAPEVRAAITEQGAGLITDVGIRLTKVTEALDDAVERVVAGGRHDAETDQAGLATRLVAAAVDIGLLALVYSLASSVFASVIPFVFGSRLSLPVAIVLVVLGLSTAGAIIAAFWALAGQTPGMRFLSIRVTKHGSREISAGCAVRRLLALVVSVLPAGLGLLAIARDPQRRGWHDRIAGTEVVYDTVRRVAPHSGGRAEATATERAR